MTRDHYFEVVEHKYYYLGSFDPTKNPRSKTVAKFHEELDGDIIIIHGNLFTFRKSEAGSNDAS